MKSKLGFVSILFLLATLLLKISGLIRDMVIAYYFGDSYMADAYLAAFVIPNMLILFLTTGMKNALVPSYIHELEKNRGYEHLRQVFTGTLIISFMLTVAGLLLPKLYIPLLYPNFSAEAKEIAITVSIILFASLLFVGMNAVLEAYFDAENKFSLSIVAQMIVVVTTIVCAILFAKEIGVHSLAYGYLAGTILSFLFKLFITIPKKKIKISTKINWLEIKSFYIIFVPVALTVAVGQINLTVDNIFASYFEEGAVTYVNYAKNLVHFPQAIFGVTIGTIIFPLLSKANAKQDIPLFRRAIEQGLTTMLFILLPSIVGMMILMPNIIELLYQRGVFGTEATIATSQVAYYYFGSVLMFSLHNVINKGFYTLKKGHLIMMIGGLAIIVNAVLNYLFTNWMGYIGIPLASSVMALFYVGACFILFLKLVKGIDLPYIGIEYVKITISVVIMGVCARYIYTYIGMWTNLLQIITIAIVGAVVYMLCIVLLRTSTFSVILQRFKNGKGDAKL